MKKNDGFMLIEVVMAFFLITLLGTLIILVYVQTIKKYDAIREERKAHILVDNLHQEFLANPNAKKFSEAPAGILYFDEHLRVCGANVRYSYRVFYGITDIKVVVKEEDGVNPEESYIVRNLYISAIRKDETDLISDVRLGKARLS